MDPTRVSQEVFQMVGNPNLIPLIVSGLFHPMIWSPLILASNEKHPFVWQTHPSALGSLGGSSHLVNG